MKIFNTISLGFAKGFLKSGSNNLSRKYFSDIWLKNNYLYMNIEMPISVIRTKDNDSGLTNLNNKLFENLDLNNLKINDEINKLDEEVSIEMKGRNSKVPKRVRKYILQ